MEAKETLRLTRARMRQVSDHAAPRRHVSAAAASTSAKTVEDHIVPVGIIHDWILEENPNEAMILRTVETHLAVAVITKEEDNRLNNAGLRQKMPENWAWGDDILARYTKCDIVLTHYGGTSR